jgi:hypothetical protein
MIGVDMLKGNKDIAIKTIHDTCIKIVQSVYSGHHLVNFNSPMYDKLNSQINDMARTLAETIIASELPNPDMDKPVSGIINKKDVMETAQTHAASFFEKISSSTGSIARKRTSAFKSEFQYAIDKLSREWKNASREDKAKKKSTKLR